MSIDADTAPQSHSDDASVALQRQIDALRHSEQIAEPARIRGPASRAGQQFIAQHPAMLENPTIAQTGGPPKLGNEGHGLEPHSRGIL